MLNIDHYNDMDFLFAQLRLLLAQTVVQSYQIDQLLNLHNIDCLYYMRHPYVKQYILIHIDGLIH